ncbi:MAG: DUF3822 family protein [Candidatus Symbiothrix sp.]|jgi:hypothetical protein|nr:DUF3822 family protein [Candidatus Symbiothrix sp.]
MEIRLPENMHLNRLNESILTIEVHPDRVAFSLSNPDNEEDSYYHSISGTDLSDAFSQFQNAYFDNVFFACSFKKVQIINYLSIFTFVPAILFEEEDEEEYTQFLFTSASGKILHQYLQKQAVILLHELPQNIYDFFKRTFVDAQFMHWTALFITHCHKEPSVVAGNCMFISKQEQAIYILCFSQDNLLLCNQFECKKDHDAAYYVLYIWKQLQFDQQKDFVYIADTTPVLLEELKRYIAHIAPLQIPSLLVYES